MPDLYLGKIPIVYRDLNEGFLRGLPDAEHRATGAVPRDYAADPVEMRDSPDKMEPVKESDWDAIFEERQKAGSGLGNMLIRALESGEFDFLDQNGFPDCWAHSTAHAIMVDRLRQGLPFVKLNAVAVATLLGRTNGGWCGLSMKFARERGYPPVGTGAGEWPYQSRRGQNTAALQQNMTKYQSLSDWYDLGRAEYDQTLTKQQLATCLFANSPSPSDYNEFGHSMLSVDWVRTEKGVWGPLTLNSWKGFGYHGLCVLAARVPDGACSLRVSRPSS